jgi:hypothetical protein
MRSEHFPCSQQGRETGTSGRKYFTMDRAGVIENVRYNMQSRQVTSLEENSV